jgi:hypothetical protein
MAISREELKKLVIKEMLEQDLKNEGVSDWLRSKASSVLTTTGKKMTQAGEKVAPPPQLDDKTLRKVGDFLQMAQRDPGITKAILATEFGKQVFGSDEEDNLKEALGADFIKMIKNKKVTPQMLTDFIDSMKKNEKANKMMTSLGLIPKGSKPVEKSDVQQTQTGDTEVSDSDIESEEPASTPEQDAAPAQPAAASLTAKPPPQPQAGDFQGQEDARRITKINDMLKDPQNSQKVSAAISQGLDPRTGEQLSARAAQSLKQHYGLAEPAQPAAAQPAEVPDVVSGTEVATKNAKIKFLAPVDEEPQTGQQIAKTNADKLGVLKKKFDSGGVLNAKEKDELLRLLGALPPTKTKKPIAKRPTSKTKKQITSSLQRGMQKSGGRLGESLQEAIVEEIFNLLTGKTK